MILYFCYLEVNETSNIQEYFAFVRLNDSKKMNFGLKLQGQNELPCGFVEMVLNNKIKTKTS